MQDPDPSSRCAPENPGTCPGASGRRSGEIGVVTPEHCNRAVCEAPIIVKRRLRICHGLQQTFPIIHKKVSV